MIRHDQRSWFRVLILLGAALALALVPLIASARINDTLNGGDTPGDREGDPIDSNDYGSGGSGDSHDNIGSAYAVAGPARSAPGIVVGKWMLLLVPDRSLGVTVFSFVVLEQGAADGEAAYAR